MWQSWVLPVIAIIIACASFILQALKVAFHFGRVFVSRDELEKCKTDINNLEKRFIEFNANRRLPQIPMEKSDDNL